MDLEKVSRTRYHQRDACHDIRTICLRGMGKQDILGHIQAPLQTVLTAVNSSAIAKVDVEFSRPQVDPNDVRCPRAAVLLVPSTCSQFLVCACHVSLGMCFGA